MVEDDLKGEQVEYLDTEEANKYEDILLDLNDCRYAGKIEDSEKDDSKKGVLESRYGIILEVLYDNILVGDKEP